MKKLLGAVFLALFATSAVHAATAQQSLMTTCNKDASGKKGDERKAFMKSCLSDGKKRQQEKMKVCNTEVAGKKGAERKTALSECLRN